MLTPRSREWATAANTPPSDQFEAPLEAADCVDPEVAAKARYDDVIKFACYPGTGTSGHHVGFEELENHPGYLRRKNAPT